jgi:molybdate/tungstate transport system substrate-binding protein
MWNRVGGALTALCLATVGLAACGSSPTASGPVDVLFAGSLVGALQGQLAPQYDKATGYTFSGVPGGSDALASAIKGKLRQADVFVSASPAADAALEGPANGSWVSWYATFATSPLVLGYNPKSRFAHALQTEPWYEVVAQPGFLLGRTDPATDPKGKLAVKALDQAANAHRLPALAKMGSETSDVFPEETLVGRLQAGQLDAGFFYTSESSPAHLPTIALGASALQATYTVTVVAGAPHPAAAASFVSYLLGPEGRRLLGQDGFLIARPPELSGSLRAVPAKVAKLLS